jgi:hypothetical protein
MMDPDPVPGVAAAARRRVASALLALPALLVAGCATVHGPTSFTLGAAEMERSVQAELGSVLKLFEGMDVRRPEVNLMPVSNRLALVWTVNVPGVVAHSAFGDPLAVGIVLSGTPRLNPARNGVDLTDVRLEDVRMSGLPRLFGFGLQQLDGRKGAALPDLPLFPLPADRLTRAAVAYEVTGLEVTYQGLRIDIAPK